MSSNLENNSNNNSPSNNNKAEEQENINEQSNSFSFLNRLSMSPETTRILSLDPFSRDNENLNNIDKEEMELGGYRHEEGKTDSPDFNRVQTNKRDFSNINDRGVRADKISAAKTPPNVKALSTADIKRFIDPGVLDQTEYELFDSELSQFSIIKEAHNDDSGPTYQFQPGAKRVKTQSDLGDSSMFRIPEIANDKDISISLNITGSEIDISPSSQKDQNGAKSSKINYDESNLLSENASFSYKASDISNIQDLSQTQDYQGEKSALNNLDTSSSLAGLTKTNEQSLSNFGENSTDKSLHEAHKNADVGFSELQNTSEQYKQEADGSNLISDIEIPRSKDSLQHESPDSYKDDDTYKNLRRPMDHINSDEFDRRESVPMDFTLNSIYLPAASKRASLETRNSIPMDGNPFSSFSLHPNNQTYDPFQSDQSHMVPENEETVQESLDNTIQSENTQQNIESSNFNQSQHFNITIPELSGKDTQDSISNIETHDIDSYPLDTGSQRTNASQSTAQYSDHQDNISVAPSLPSHYDSQLPSRMSFGMVSFGINISMADHINSRGVSRLGFGFGPDTQNSGFQSNANTQNDEQSTSIHIDQDLITEIDASKNPILQTNHGVENESRSPKVKSAGDRVQDIGGSAEKLNLSYRSVHISSSRNSTPNSKSLLSTKSTPTQIKNENSLSQIKSPNKLSSPNIKLTQSENLSFSTTKSPKSSLEFTSVKERFTDKLNSTSGSIQTPSPKKLNPQPESQQSKRSNSSNRTPEKTLNQALSSNRSSSTFKAKTDSPLKKLGISFDELSSDKIASTAANSGYSPSKYGVSNISNSATKSNYGNSPNTQTIKSENSPYSKHTPSKQSENRSINNTPSPQVFASASKSYNFESPSRSRIYNRDSHPNITTPSVSNFIFPGNDAILPNEIIVSSNHTDKGTPDKKMPEISRISPRKSTPLKPRYEDLSNTNLDDDLFPDTSMASVLQYTSQNQLNESQVDNFLAESGDSNADLEQFLNRDHMPKLTLKQFYEAVGLDINNSAAFGELNEGEIEVGELSQDVLNLEDSDDQSQANTTIAQYIISSLKSQQKQFYDDMCQAIKSEIDQASSHCQIFENIVKSTGSLVIENYTNMLEKDRPEFEKSIRANFDDLKNSQLEEFLNKMEDGLNQYESKLLDLIPVLDKSVKNIEDYSFVVAQIKEKLESHFDDLTKQLKAEERENIGVESYRTQIAETKSATEHATLEDSELSTKNSELSEKLDELKSKLLELEKEEKTLQSQVSRLSPDTHLFSKREYSRLNAKYRELISETSIEPKSISENSLLFLLDDQVEIFLSNPKQGGLDYKSLNLKLVEFYTEEQKQILNSFISRLEAYIKANKTHLKLRGLLKFVSKAWHQFHLILEKLSHPKLEPIAKLEVYPLEYYSVTSTSPIFFLQTTLTVHNDIGTETRNEIVVTNKFTIDDMLKFPNCLGTVKAEKTSGNVKDYEMVRIKNNLKFYKKFDPISIMYDAQAAVNLIDLPKDKSKVKSSPKRAPFRYSFANPTKSEIEESRVDLDKFKNIKSFPNAREKLEKLPELGPDETPTFLHTFKAYLIRKGLFEEFMGSNKI